MEQFIERCCRSLFEQTLDRIEYIFINDCSPDKSVDIIKKTLKDYPNRQQQVRVINHVDNQGVTKSREEGNQLAKGEYLIHCDSDDWLDKEAYEIMYSEGEKNNADIVCCNYIVSGESEVLCKYSITEETKKNLSFSIQPLYGAVWNKLIRKNLYIENDVHFFEGINMSEDLGLILRLRFFSKKTIIINKPLYYHSDDNTNSIVNNFTIEKCLQIVECVKKLELFFKGQNVENKYFLQLQYLKYQSKQMLLFNQSVRNIEKWKSIFPETHKYIWKFNESPLNNRVVAWLLYRKMPLVAKFLLFTRDNI